MACARRTANGRTVAVQLSVGGQPVESHLSVGLWISDPAVRAAGHVQ